MDTGKIRWQPADPAHGVAMGSVSVANGVLYALSICGNMHALDASTGRILWTFQSGGAVLDGPAIVDGTLFWGSGYRKPGGCWQQPALRFALAPPAQWSPGGRA